MINYTRETGPSRMLVSARGKEAGPMSCILNRGGKCDQLLVIIERGRPALLDCDRAERCNARAKQNLTIATTAGGTGRIMPDACDAIAISCRIHGSYTKHRHHLGVPASGTI